LSEGGAIVRDGSRVQTLLPAPPDHHFVANGGHFAYLSPCNDMLERAAPNLRKPRGL
jgi:hypothetical protein